MDTVTKPRRRADAATYLNQKFGIPITANGLAKLAVTGDGPAMIYFNRIPLYREDALDAWANAKLSQPVTSTAGRREARAA